MNRFAKSKSEAGKLDEDPAGFIRDIGYYLYMRTGDEFFRDKRFEEEEKREKALEKEK